MRSLKMTSRRSLSRIMTFCLVALIAAATLSKIQAQGGKSIEKKSIEARLQALEDREAIHNLMIDYGRTLDHRDFAGFARLFTEDAEYGGGGGGGAIRGPEAIAKLLQDTFEKNPTGVKTPNFHLFSNETIQLDGDQALGLSKGVFVVPGEKNQPEMVMLATYKDIFVRKNGAWKFKQRMVQGNIPSPAAPAR
jgi:uncharacterized protein (TIGR02246 family)